ILPATSPAMELNFALSNPSVNPFQKSPRPTPRPSQESGKVFSSRFGPLQGKTGVFTLLDRCEALVFFAAVSRREASAGDPVHRGGCNYGAAFAPLEVLHEYAKDAFLKRGMVVFFVIPQIEAGVFIVPRVTGIASSAVCTGDRMIPGKLAP
ncbi:MAG: hypothetical protein P8018_04730, partial [Acidobacteriota bacterium]